MINVAAQDNPVVINVFKGLNDSKNQLLVQPGEGMVASNIDFSKTIGSLRPRRGFGLFSDKIAFGNITSGGYTSLYSTSDRFGQKRMFAVFERFVSGANTWDVVGWTNVNDTGIGLNQNLGEVYGYRGSQFYWTTLQDIIIYANGINRPGVWYGDSILPTNPLVAVPPGHFDMAPFADTGGGSQTLNGDYYYGWRVSSPCSLTATRHFYSFPDSLSLSGPSWQIHVDNDWVEIFGLKWVGITALCDLPSSGANDSTIIQIARTRAGGQIHDSMFLIVVLAIEHLGSFGVTDSIPDDSLGIANFPFVGFIDTVQHTADTTSDSTYEIGQPTWLSVDTADHTDPWQGIARNGDTSLWIWRGTHYFVAYYDSATEMMSDSGPAVRIPVAYRDTGAAGFKIDTIWDTSYTIGLPPATHNNRFQWRLICRGQEILAEKPIPDSSEIWYVYDADCSGLLGVPRCRCGVAPGSVIPDTESDLIWDNATSQTDFIRNNIGELFYENGVAQCRIKRFRTYDPGVPDTVIGPFYILDTIKILTDSIYVDVLPWSNVFSEKPIVDFDLGLTQIPMNFPTVVNSRLYIAEGSRVHYSDPGIPGKWPVVNIFSIDVETGDKITSLHDGGDFLHVFTNKTWYTAKKVAAGHVFQEVVPNLGCVAHGSVIDIPGGGLAFLSQDGIYMFNHFLKSDFKTSGGNISRISNPIKDHLEYGIDTLSNCWAWLTPDDKMVCFSLSTLDTTWAYSLETGQWTDWDFSFRQTTRYDTTTRTDIVLPSQVIGILGDSDSIFVFGSSLTDTGKAVAMKWRTPVYKGTVEAEIYQMNLWQSTTASADTSLIVRMLNSANTVVDSIVDVTRLFTRAYEIFIGDPSQYWQVEIETSSDVEVREIDLWLRKTGEPTKH